MKFDVWMLLLIVVVPMCVGCAKRKPEIALQKIVFHTSGCFGKCPTYHLEINEHRTISFHAEKVYSESGNMEPDSSRIGYFVGKLQPETFRKLNRQLYDADIENIDPDDKLCCDGSVKTLIAYYNGKRKYIKSMFPPNELRDVMETLYAICEDKNLVRTDNPFGLEH